MTSTTEPKHLNNHHRDTLQQIFRHPVSHNIEWRAVLSLLEFVGDVEEVHEGRFRVSLGPETETFDRPKTKDIDVQQVVDLRRMLKNAGYSTESNGDSNGDSNDADLADEEVGADSGADT